MKLSTREDTGIPAAALFSSLTDFDALGRQLEQRGVQVVAGADGASWQLAFDLQGRRREVDLRLAEMTPSERVMLAGQSEAFDLTLGLTVIALSPKRSRVNVELEVKPRNMRARLMLQTARLGRAKLETQFSERVGRFVRGLGAAGA